MTRILFSILLATGFSVAPLFNISSSAQTRNKQIEELKKQIDELQRQNQQQIEELRKKIEQLEVQKETDQKKIEELAAKKVEEGKDAWWKNVQIDYKKPGDGFTIKTKDENFSLRTRFLGQVQFSVNDRENSNTATDFRIRRLRIVWDGNAYRPWLLYSVQVDADSGGLSLRDAYFDLAYDTRIAPRVGQYKVPFSREQLNSATALQLVERSILDEEFGFGRDRGAAIYGVLGNFITYGAGVFNGDGRNGTSSDSNLLYTGRVQFTPCCGELKYKQGSFPTGGDYNFEPNFGPKDKPLIAVSAGVAIIPGLNVGRKTPDNDIDERFVEIFGEDVIDAGNAQADVFEFTADASLRYWIFNLEGDYFVRHVSPDGGGFASPTDQGFRVQSGVFLVPEFIEVAGRFVYIGFDDDIGGRDSKFEITPGLNFYFSKSHKWKLQFSYSFIRDKDTVSEETDQNVFRTQLQAYF